jgi:hypothetical protein
MWALSEPSVTYCYPVFPAPAIRRCVIVVVGCKEIRNCVSGGTFIRMPNLKKDSRDIV